MFRATLKACGPLTKGRLTKASTLPLWQAGLALISIRKKNRFEPKQTKWNLWDVDGGESREVCRSPGACTCCTRTWGLPTTAPSRWALHITHSSLRFPWSEEDIIYINALVPCDTFIAVIILATWKYLCMLGYALYVEHFLEVRLKVQILRIFLGTFVLRIWT